MKSVFYILGFFLASLFVSLLVWSGIVWILCWALTAIGITVIGGWTVAFSWKLVIIVALIYSILHGIFSPTVHKN